MGCKITQKDIESKENNEEFGGSSFMHYTSVIYFSIFVRSTYLFFLVIGFLVMNFNIFGVVIAVLGIIVDYAVLIRYAKKIESSLPFDYLRRAGQLSIFGYNILNDDDYDQEENNDRIMINNGNDNVHVTTMSLDKFSADLDKPMIVGSKDVNENEDNNKQNEPDVGRSDNYIGDDHDGNDQVEVHVRDEILDEDEDDVSSDHETTHSTVR